MHNTDLYYRVIRLTLIVSLVMVVILGGCTVSNNQSDSLDQIDELSTHYERKIMLDYPVGIYQINHYIRSQLERDRLEQSINALPGVLDSEVLIHQGAVLIGVLPLNHHFGVERFNLRREILDFLTETALYDQIIITMKPEEYAEIRMIKDKLISVSDELDSDWVNRFFMTNSDVTNSE